MQKLIYILIILFTTQSLSREEDWVKTEGEITEITVHRVKRVRESAIIKFYLENGAEQYGISELFRIPFIGSMKSAGDTITINYNKNNPVLLESVFEKFLTNYGMSVLIILGIIFSIKPFLKRKNEL
jgi:hypothetical protein